jgi:hypothetical protein
MSYQTPWHTKKKDPGAYGHIMINRIVGGLPLPELREYEQLQKVKRKKRTKEQQDRMEVLWAEATKLHSEARSRGEVWNATHDSETPSTASS